MENRETVTSSMHGDNLVNVELKSEHLAREAANFFPRGFIKKYFEYAEPLTDAPPQFHIPTALTVLSTAVGNKVYLQLGDKRLYPNIWALILAPSSTHRKTSSMEMGLNLIRGLDPKLLMPNDFSLEALLEHLTTQPQGIMSYSEFSILLEMCNRTYLAGLKEILTDLYDCRPLFTRKLKTAEFTIQNPCLSLIGASTTEWLVNKMSEGDIRGGFMARFLYFPAARKVKSLPIPPKVDEKQKLQLIEELRSLQAFTGEMAYSDEARVIYEEWYRKNEKSVENEIRSDLLSSFFNRLPDYCWKLAMLYAISVEGTMTISGKAMSDMIALTEYMKHSIRGLVGEFEFSEEGQNKKKVLKIVRNYQENRKEMMPYSLLLQHSHLKAQKLKEALSALVDEKQIVWDREWHENQIGLTQFADVNNETANN